jgi:molybdopterin-dependent oxidoreductase alpha subunit
VNETDDLEISQPAEAAAGLDAVASSVKAVAGKMGLIRGARGLLKLNQKGGIDCQSCAWPDPEERSFNEYCESGAKALADEATTKTIGREFFARYTVDELSRKTDHWLNAQGRIAEPLILREGRRNYEPISWDEAFNVIASTLNSLASPDEAIFYTSGRTSNEAAFLYQLFVRQFGTNNLPDCSNMCHESTSVALAESIGIGKATVRLEDFEKTDLVIVIGQNPGTNAPRMMTSLAAAKAAGAKMIAVNPLREAGLTAFRDPNPQHGRPLSILGGKPVKLADLHLPVRIGGDMAFLKGVMKCLLERERAESGTVFDHEFIAAFTNGYEELVAALDATRWEGIHAASGLERPDFDQAAEMIASARSFITCWAMGITQHTEAVATIQDIVNLHLLLGSIGRPGAGLCPVRGHSNVQGDRTMGIWEKMNPVFRANLEREFAFTAPIEDGLNTVESIDAMSDGQAKVFFALGGNFSAASSDTSAVESALRKCDLTAQVITKLNRTALVPGRVSLILPCLGRSEIDRQTSGEQFVSTESTMLNVQMSKGIFEPASEHLRSEPWIVARLAQATLGDRSSVDWEVLIGDYDLIRERIERVVPGFENFNARVREAGGFYLPNPAREREFATASRKAVFRSSELKPMRLERGRLMLTTIRSHDQFNTTVYGFDDRYRGINGSRRVILMNAVDIVDRGLSPGEKVDITSYFEDGERQLRGFTVVEYEIPRDCAAAYFPEANPLVPLKSFAKRSGTPTSKCIVISVARAA